jgi:outer membrane protein TolC
MKIFASMIAGLATCTVATQAAAVEVNEICQEPKETNPYIYLDKIMSKAAVNKTVQSSKNSFLASLNTWKAKSKYFTPSLSFKTDYIYYDTPTKSKYYDGNVATKSDYLVYYQYTSPYLYLTWNILNIEDIFTERYYRFQKDASKEDQIITGIDQALKAGNTLLELSKLTHNLEVNTSLKDIYDKTYSIQKEKRRSGLVSDLEVNDSYVQKITFEKNIELLKSNIRKKYIELARLLESDDFCTLRPDFNEDIFLHTSAEVLAQINSAYKNDPKLKKLNAKIKSEDSSALQNKYSYVPSITTTGVLGTSYYTGQISGSADKPNEYLNSGTSYIAVSLTWDFFDGNKRLDQMKSAQYKSKSIQNERDAYILEFNSRLSSIGESLEMDKRSYALGREAFQVLTNQVGLTQEGYINGYKTILDLQNSTNQLATTSSELAQTWVDIISSMLEFESKINFPTLKNSKQYLSYD